MRDEKEERKKQGQTNKQGKATQHTQGSHFTCVCTRLHNMDNNYGAAHCIVCTHPHSTDNGSAFVITGGREETQLDGLILHSGNIRRRRTPKHDYSHSISLSYETSVVISLYPFTMRQVLVISLCETGVVVSRGDRTQLEDYS